MRGFFAILIGIILLLGAVVSVPLSTEFLNRSGGDQAHFWRWRLLAAATLIAGAGCAIATFLLVPKLLS